MSTRSIVALMDSTGVCSAVYVHFDGYLEGVGAELQNYKTEAQVKELIAPGDRSSLTDGFYADRGETDVEPQQYTDFRKFLDDVGKSWAEYYYVFKDGVWYVGSKYYDSMPFGSLTPYAEAVRLKAEEEALDG